MSKLTKTLVERAEVKTKPYFLFDDMLTGFCVRILSTGKRHYYVQYMKHKRVKRIAVGRHGILIPFSININARQLTKETRY